MADLTPDIASQAVEPAAVAVDGQSATARPVADQIAADVYAGKGKTAGTKRRRGIMFSKLTTPGANGICTADAFDRPGGLY